MSNYSEMADRIAFECFRQGRSVNALQRDAKLSPAAVYLLRTKSVHGPTADTIVRICNELGKDPNWLLGWEETFDQIVDAQPTVETVVRGEWKPSDDYKGYVTCSRCRNCYVEPGWVINRKWKYCPNCGAKMNGGAK